MKTILCFGDSNTWGQHAPLGDRFDEQTRWGSRLRTLLGEDYRVIEEGQRGRTTVWDDPIENRLAGLTYLWPCLDSHAPIDLVVIMLGTNDCKPYFGARAQSIANGAGRLVDMVQKCNFGPDGTAPKAQHPGAHDRCACRCFRRWPFQACPHSAYWPRQAYRPLPSQRGTCFPESPHTGNDPAKSRYSSGA